METITREFTRRGEDKAIATVKLEVPTLAGWRLDGVELPEDSAFALANFSLQMLQDAYAGKKLRSEAITAFKQKYDRLRAGTLGARSAATGTTAVERAAFGLAIAYICTKLGVKSEAKLADHAGNVESETGEPFVTTTEGGNLRRESAPLRAFIARHDAMQADPAMTFMARAEVMVGAKAAKGIDVPL